VTLTDLLALGVLADGGSLVLVHHDLAAARPGPERDRLAAVEQVTSTGG